MKLIEGRTIRLCEKQDSDISKLNKMLNTVFKTPIKPPDILDMPEGLHLDLKYIINQSPSARELVQYFIDNKIFVFIVPISTMTTQAMVSGEFFKRRINPKNKVVVVWLGTNMPVYFALSSHDVRMVNWALVVLHEMGHAWQEIEYRDWFVRERDYYDAEIRGMRTSGQAEDDSSRKKLLGSAYITLDYNNLENWEWPICAELRSPIRQSYYLYISHKHAARALQGFKSLPSRRANLFFDYYYDIKSRGGSWRPVPNYAKPHRDWNVGAPHRRRRH